MIKKIVLGVLFVGLVGALVAGAVNRTAAKSGDDNYAEQRGAGWAGTQADGAVLTANAESRGGQGGGRNAVLGTGETAAAGQGGHRQRQALTSGQGGGQRGQAAGVPGSNTPLAETEDHQWVAVSGTVTSVDDTQMTVQTGSGEIVIADRPWSFAVEAGFTAQPGDQVTLDGFYEDNVFEAGRLTNGDLIVSIREESGRPLWAGRGRWSAQGQGRGG